MNNHRLNIFKRYLTRIITLVSCVLCLVSLMGCEAFVRKFTRKPKKENLPKEEMIIAPQEYTAPSMTKEELYRQYFLYWKSWHDELIDSLSPGANHKRQRACINETIKNLEQLRKLLSAEKKEKLDIYINQLKKLNELITKDLYGNNISKNCVTAEQIKMNILRDFSYNKISKDIS